MSQSFRKTTQTLLPLQPPTPSQGQYNLYPIFQVTPGTLQTGFGPLASQLAQHSRATLDGMPGVMWPEFLAQLEAALDQLGVKVTWVDVGQALKPADQLERLTQPYLGGNDPLFGKIFTGAMADFFDPQALEQLQRHPTPGLSIVFGPGAALAGWDGPLLYLDLPKNELQFRARAGCPTNLGQPQALPPREAYKRSYFVDWPVLRKHQAQLLPRMDLLVDAQRPNQPSFIPGTTLRQSLDQMSRNFFRVRPWFEPGPWGGQWIRRQVPGLPQEVPNIAWSFELITPENGLLLGNSDGVVEASFDFLMAQAAPAILGEAAQRFGLDFPIRFDWLDTVEGGNLSVQCHPRPEYMRQQFGEPFTQDETYYILDAAPEATVYLGFQDGIQPAKLRQALEHSVQQGQPVEVERFVQVHPARKHDLFLIPSGTVHCAGQGSLVLEISATPYIFTFKMYDWLRLDLEGKPRPLNLDRAFDNLVFERAGPRVREELISHPHEIDHGTDWQVIHYPTHPEHFYDIHRLDFATAIEVPTHNQCHILALVEGSSIVLETQGGYTQVFSHAETFVVPAAAQSYRLINQGTTPARVVKAFVKPQADQAS